MSAETPAPETSAALLRRAADRLDELDQAARPGPWRVESHGTGLQEISGPPVGDEYAGSVYVGETEGAPNAALIVAMRPLASEMGGFFRRQSEVVQPDGFAVRWARVVLGEPNGGDPS